MTTTNGNKLKISIARSGRNKCGFYKCPQWYSQQYFTYFVAVSFIGAGYRSTMGKTTNLSQWTGKLHHLSLVSSAPRNWRNITDNISGDRNWLHGHMKIQLPYERAHDVFFCKLDSSIVSSNWVCFIYISIFLLCQSYIFQQI